jgi:hypothetical protein
VREREGGLLLAPAAISIYKNLLHINAHGAAAVIVLCFRRHSRRNTTISPALSFYTYGRTIYLSHNIASDLTGSRGTTLHSHIRATNLPAAAAQQQAGQQLLLNNL